MSTRTSFGIKKAAAKTEAENLGEPPGLSDLITQGMDD